MAAALCLVIDDYGLEIVVIPLTTEKYLRIHHINIKSIRDELGLGAARADQQLLERGTGALAQLKRFVSHLIHRRQPAII